MLNTALWNFAIAFRDLAVGKHRKLEFSNVKKTVYSWDYLMEIIMYNLVLFFYNLSSWGH